MTTDQNAAKAFYGSLFGWTAVDQPMGPDSVYTIFRMDGRDAAGGFQMSPQEVAARIPTHWHLYIAVESADVASQKAAGLGGRILEQPFDVSGIARMAVIQDPTGAVFSVFEAKRHTGLGITGEPGALCWADLSTPDPEKAKQFYSGLFGWEFIAGDEHNSGFLHIRNVSGGILPAQHHDPQTPAHWRCYFSVRDAGASVKKAQELGGRVCAPPIAIEAAGRMSILADAQGAAFAIFQSAQRD